MIRKRLFSVCYMFLLTLFFTGLVSGINTFNREKIEINEKLKFRKVVLSVLNINDFSGASDAEITRLFNKRVTEVSKQGKNYYIGLSTDGKTVIGFAFPLFGPGFWGPVYGMMAVDPRRETVLGIAFYRHNETPGLGGRITEDWFVEQFVGKRLLPAMKQKYFRFRPQGTSPAENDLDGITGATQTSYAVERLVNKCLSEYLPLLAG